MKSKSMLATVAPMLVLGMTISGVSLPTNSYAQDNQDIQAELAEQLEEASEVVQEASETVEETIEEVADHVAEVGEEFSKALEKWMRRHSGELENWSEEHGDQWTQWAEQLEQRVEKWSVDQEKKWKSWAEHYEEEMATLSKQLKKDELSSEDVGNLVETNLRLLAEIPIGQMIEQGIRAGANELESAPWESLNDLSRIAGEAASDSVEAAEKITGSAVNRALRTSFNHGEDLNAAREKLETEFHRQRGAIEQLFQRRIEALTGLLEEDGDDGGDAQKMIERLEKVREQKIEQLERQHDRQILQAERSLEQSPPQKEIQELREQVELLRQEVQRLKEK
jgi:hypothetical protein